MKHLVLLIGTLSLSLINLYTQEHSSPPAIPIDKLDFPGNSASKHIQAINQDAYGFMWFGSQNGLHRWDGYNFKSFRHQPNDSSSISSSYAEVIHVASDGSLWVGTFGGGLNQFHFDTETFSRYQHDTTDQRSISSDLVTAIAEDREGNLWVATMDGLNYFNRTSKEFTRYLHHPDDPSSLSAANCRSLYIDAAGTIWAGTGAEWLIDEVGGLNRYRPESDDFEHYFHQRGDSSSLLSNKITAIHEDSQGRFWIGTAADGLHLMDRKRGTFQRLQQNGQPLQELSPKNNEPLLNWGTQFIEEDNQGNLWIGTWRDGFNYFNPETGTIAHLTVMSTQGILEEDNAWTMFQSSDGIIWLCTAGPSSGVYRVRIQPSPIALFRLPSATDKILAFHEDPTGKVWIATAESGLWFWKNGQYYQEQRIKMNGIERIMPDDQGALWLLSKRNQQLVRWHPVTNSLSSYRSAHGLKTSQISDICLDQSGQLWALNPFSNSIAVFDPETKTFKTYPLGHEVDFLADQQHDAVLRPDHEHGFWIMGFEQQADKLVNVIVRFDTDLRSIVPLAEEYPTWQVIKIPRATLQPGEKALIHDVCRDQNGDNWILTDEVLITQDHVFCIALSNRRLSTNTTFRGMALDDDKSLWVLTDQLIHTSIGQSEDDWLFFHNLGWQIKTLKDERQQLFRTRDGILLWGVEGGIQSVDPIDFDSYETLVPPPVQLVNFTFPYGTDQLPHEKQSPIFLHPTISLAHDENVFDISFAAIHFNQPENILYKFMLDGYDQHWRATSTIKTANYVNIPPGDYTFKVRASVDGINWGKTTTTQISITAPWYANRWAYSLYAMLFFTLLYILYNFQLRSQLSQAEANRLQALNIEKSRLYTNITHEFRTPLTVILGLAETLEEQIPGNAKSALQLIQRNGMHLLRSINQILDLAKLEHQQLALNLQQANLVSFARYVAESFVALADEKEVNLVAYAESEDILMDFDPEKLQVIISNLLSNAIKFTPHGGQIILHLQAVKHSTGEDMLLLKVKDSGIGMTAEEQTRVFSRFFQTAESEQYGNTGTGIGLALVKELVTLMKGNIQLKSTKDKGTEVTIELPITQQTALFTGHSSLIKQHPIFSNKLMVPEISTATKNNGEQPLLLIIEDNKDVAYFLKTCLSANYRLLFASDGFSGLEMAREQLPDLIVSDIMMPKVNGYEVCKQLKTDQQTDHIPVILLTAKASPNDRLHGLSLGADAYLTKPFNKTELFTRIDHLILLRQKLKRKLTENPFQQLLTNQEQNNVGEKFLQQLIQLVLDHLEEPEFGPSQLAKKLHISESNLYRKLKSITGKSTGIFIRSIRLQQAKILIQSTQKNISEIAYDVGFNDAAWFSRAFKVEFGYPPIAAREITIE